MNEDNEIPLTTNSSQLFKSDYLLAESSSMSGEFFLEFLDIQVSVSDQDVDDISAGQDSLHAEKIGKRIVKKNSKTLSQQKKYAQFMQVQHHELSHLFQVLIMPVFQTTWHARNHFLKTEAIILLKYFEGNGSIPIKKVRHVMDLIDLGYCELEKDEESQFKKIESQKIFYMKYWFEKNNGISLFDLIEGMAHYMSMYLTDTPEVDNLELVGREYHCAFELFQTNFDTKIEVRWQYILFIYFCYFSGQHYNHSYEEDGLLPVKIFHLLCSRASIYFDSLKVLSEKYLKYNKNELLELVKWNIEPDDLKEISRDSIASVYAFFELIEMIEEESNKYGTQKRNVNVQGLEQYVKGLKDYDLHHDSKYSLAQVLVFPKKFLSIRNIHDEIQQMKVDDTSFSYIDEIEFYRFINNCKSLLRPSQKVLCCSEHGAIENRDKVLHCKNEDGLAMYLMRMIGRPAYDLFTT